MLYKVAPRVAENSCRSGFGVVWFLFICLGIFIHHSEELSDIGIPLCFKSVILCLPCRENFVHVIEENLNYLELFSSILQEVRQEQNNSVMVSLMYL